MPKPFGLAGSSFLTMLAKAFCAAAGLTQNSSVKSPLKSRAGASGTLNLLFAPSNPNASPTIPGTVATSVMNPVWAPAMSDAVPPTSGHHATIPRGIPGLSS